MLAVIAAVLVATLVAACGASHRTHARRSARPGGAIQFAKCMRASGVPSFPDSGGALHFSASGQIVSINGVAVSSPAFESAQQKCEHYLSNSASVSPAEQATFRQENLKVARCMRAHGIASYPDSGTFATSGDLNPQAPAFQAAAKKCGLGIATGVSLP